MKILSLLAGLFLSSHSFAQTWTPPRALCPSTPFNCDIENAINRGLQFTRSIVNGNVLGNKRHNFFGILALLEKRRGIGWGRELTNIRGS